MMYDKRSVCSTTPFTPSDPMRSGLRFVRFHGMRSRADLFPVEPKIESFLTDLPVNGNVAAATQNQAMNALVFLCMTHRSICFSDFPVSSSGTQLIEVRNNSGHISQKVYSRSLPRLRHRTGHGVLRHLKRPAAPECASRTLFSGSQPSGAVFDFRPDFCHAAPWKRTLSASDSGQPPVGPKAISYQ